MPSMLTRPWGRRLLLTALLVPLAACAQVRDHKGYVGDTMLIDSVQPGIDNKESVAKTLGAPSFVGQWDQNIWYYWARNTKQLAFQMPRPTQQLLMTVRFDARANVASDQRTGAATNASDNPSGDKTPTLGRNRGFFGELFGNIGAVGAANPGGSTTDNPN